MLRVPSPSFELFLHFPSLLEYDTSFSQSVKGSHYEAFQAWLSQDSFAYSRGLVFRRMRCSRHCLTLQAAIAPRCIHLCISILYRHLRIKCTTADCSPNMFKLVPPPFLSISKRSRKVDFGFCRIELFFVIFCWRDYLFRYFLTGVKSRSILRVGDTMPNRISRTSGTESDDDQSHLPTKLKQG